MLTWCFVSGHEWFGSGCQVSLRIGSAQVECLLLLLRPINSLLSSSLCCAMLCYGVRQCELWERPNKGEDEEEKYLPVIGGLEGRRWVAWRRRAALGFQAWEGVGVKKKTPEPEPTRLWEGPEPQRATSSFNGHVDEFDGVRST
ncbi:hypothetical protein CRG98_004735 [Punica granatum]|uniref:Uncharacterized protein n=1 Tax=Punica granatum TaxID=22663 RepID=A0A2I0L2V9_PUNGR|nr:hypothetical protein CRG98_004735 [Punica granatum]